MNKTPSRRKTTKSVAIRRPDSEPEPTRAQRNAETAPPRAGKATVPAIPKPRKTTKADLKAQKETVRPRREPREDPRAESTPPSSRRDAREAKEDARSESAPPSRRDSKAASKRGTVPPRTKRDSKAPKTDGAKDGDNGPHIRVRVDAPFRVTAELPDPQATRYSVIPSPRPPRKPAR